MNRSADPFSEINTTVASVSAGVLGARCEFNVDDKRLVRLVHSAFGELPAHALQRRAPRFHFSLSVTSDETLGRSGEPPPVHLYGRAGLLCGTVDRCNFAILAPELRRGIIVFSKDMLRHEYHARYELLEFAVYTLLARAQGLVPLHAACVSANGRAVLLVGDSGAGKSTLALHCLRRGMDLVSEDSSFVLPQTLRTTGVPTYLHVRDTSLRFLPHSERRVILRSPRIRRRSGVEKAEVDVRRTAYRMAPTAPLLTSVAVLSSRKAEAKALARPLSPRALLATLAACQPYAVSQPSWPAFADRLKCLQGFELRRGKHPDEGVDALLRLLR